MEDDGSPTLYTYCIPYDDGAAPNPFWGICTLVICKPVIRRRAKTGDWIVGTGSKNSPLKDKNSRPRDISRHVVYAMKVTDKMTMEEYDVFCQRECPKKIPVWDSEDWRRRLGDCIYDFSKTPPKMRIGAHNESNRATDLGGKHALISSHFYYFGDSPIELPKSLHTIVKRGQGHRSQSNAPYIDSFLSWIEGFRLEPNKLCGDPQLRFSKNVGYYASKCAEHRRKEAEADEQVASRRT